MLARFMLPMPGMQEPRVHCDPRVGGTFEIVMFVGDAEVPHTGQYQEVIPHSRLSFTWSSPASLPDSVVTLDFTAVSDNETRVDLSQVRFMDEERRADHEGGWTQILDTLAQVV